MEVGGGPERKNAEAQSEKVRRRGKGKKKKSKASEGDVRVTAKQISMCGNRW